MTRIGIIINPHSKQNKNDAHQKNAFLSKMFGSKAIVRTTSTLDEVPKVLEEFHKKDIDILAISGGDGTIIRVLSSQINKFGEKKKPIILPLKGGTWNIFCKDVGLSKDQIKVCRIAASKLSANSPIKTIKRGMLKVVDTQTHIPVYGFHWYDGYMYKFTQRYYEEGAGIRAIIKLRFEYAKVIYFDPDNPILDEKFSEIKLDDFRINKSYLFLYINSIKSNLFGFKPIVEPPIPGERLNVYRANKAYLRRPILPFIRFFYNAVKSNTEKYYTNSSAKNITVNNVKGYAVDAEIHNSKDSSTVTITPGPILDVFSLG